MKHVLCILVAFILLTIPVTAADNPIDKGSMIIGGSAYFMWQTGDAYYDNKTIALSPSVAYFVSPGTFIGGQFQLFHYEVDGYSSTDFSIGPIVGYYFSPVVDRPEARGAFYPFFLAFASFGKADGLFEDLTVTQVGGEVGATLMVSNSVGIDISALVSHDTYSVEGSSSSGLTIMAGFGLTSFIY